MSKPNPEENSLASRIKNQPVIAVTLVIAGIIGGIAGRAGALDKTGETVMRWVKPSSANTVSVAATDDYVETDEDHTVSVQLLANDRGVSDPSMLAIHIDSHDTKGGVKLSGVEAVYSPPPDFSGDDTFDYTIEKAEKKSTATVRVKVKPVNDPPTAPPIHLKLSYLMDGAAVVDLAGPAKDVEGDDITLGRFSVTPPVADQPTRALDFAKRGAAMFGPVASQDEVRLSGSVFLPISDWVDKDASHGESQTISKKLEYTLKDSKGAEADFVADIEIDVESVSAILFACKQDSGSAPDSTSFEMVYDGEPVSTIKVSKGGLSGWSFLKFSKSLYLPVFYSHTKVRETWTLPDRSFSVSCSSKVLLNSGEEIEGKEFSFYSIGVGRTTLTQDYLSKAPEIQVERKLKVMYKLAGHEPPK